MQSLIAYWDDRPRMAVDLAADGLRYTPESGTSRVRLAAIEARAHARLRDQRATEDALARAEHAREQVTEPDWPGGMMAFPDAKQTFYAATAKLWLGGRANYADAERHATRSLQLYEQDSPERRRLGELCLVRLDLAVARLALTDVEGTAEQIHKVLAIAAQRRTDSVTRRLRQLATALERPTHQTSTLAMDLRDEILTFCGAPATAALPAGTP